MPKIVRGIGAVVGGFVAASAVMVLVESLNGHVLYPELGKLAEGVTDRETMRTLLAGAPVGALLVVIVGWVLGASTGGFVAGWIGWDAPARYALVLGGLLTCAGVANNLMLPPPGWFWIPTILVFFPAALFGARLAPRRDAATS